MWLVTDRAEGDLWDTDDALFLDSGSDYMNVFAL